MYSLDLGANWKGIALRMLWQGGEGYNVAIGGSARAPFSNESVPLDYQYEYRAIVEQDANGADFISNPDQFKLPPVNQNGSTAHNNKGNDFWNINAAYLRLKNVNLSYALPKTIIEKVGVDNCVIYFSGSNMFAVSNLGIFKKSFDPEITGANNRDYPPVKTATFGIRLTL